MNGNIDFSGSLSGSILDGGSGGVKDVLVRNAQTSDFISVVDENQNANIDLISYVRRNELTQELNTLEELIDITKQDKLTAGSGIDITNNIISTTGGSGGNITQLARTDTYYRNETNISLNDEVSNYDLLLILNTLQSNVNYFLPCCIIPINEFKISTSIYSYYDRTDNRTYYVELRYTNETTIRVQSINGTISPKAIYGIKL